DASSKVADQENHGMTELLELTELSENDGMTQVEVGGARVGTELDAQRPRLTCRQLELPGQSVLGNDIDHSLTQPRDVGINRHRSHLDRLLNTGDRHRPPALLVDVDERALQKRRA